MITERPTVTLGTYSLKTVIMDLGAQKGDHAGDVVSSQLESMDRKESPWEQEQL